MRIRLNLRSPGDRFHPNTRTGTVALVVTISSSWMYLDLKVDVIVAASVAMDSGTPAP